MTAAVNLWVKPSDQNSTAFNEIVPILYGGDYSKSIVWNRTIVETKSLVRRKGLGCAVMAV